MATEIRLSLVVLSLMRCVFVMEFKMNLEKIETVVVNSTSSRTAAEIQSLEHTTVAITGCSDLLDREESVASTVVVTPVTCNVSENTKLSVINAEESLSVTSIRDREIEGTCAKVLNPSPAVQSVSNSIQRKVAFTSEGSCHFGKIAPNVSVFMFNDAKDSKGYFVNGVISYGAIGENETISIGDRADSEWNNYCDPTIEAVDSLDVLWHRKIQMEEAGGNTYILVSNRQRTTYEWLVITASDAKMDIVVSVYQSVALSQMVVNSSFSMELRDLAYENELDRSNRAA